MVSPDQDMSRLIQAVLEFLGGPTFCVLESISSQDAIDHFT